MRTRRFSLSAALLLLGAVLVGSALASGGVATKTIAFSAKYAGNANVQVTGEAADISASGKGTGTPIGPGTLTGKGAGTAVQQTCNTWSGTGLMKGTKGTVSFKVTSATACGDEEGNVFSVTGRVLVLKATGKQLAKAKGTLKFTGTYDRKAGTFAVKFAGTLKK